MKTRGGIVRVLGAMLLFFVGSLTSAGQQTEQAPLIAWQEGPTVGRLGTLAELDVPEGFAFAEAEGARTFLELTQNIPSGDELGVLVPIVGEEDDSSGHWFVIFEFRDVGYVRDDDKDALDAEALLSSIREGTEAANKTRRERGWTTLEILGWEKQPFYDTETNNLTWAIRAQSEGEAVVNYSTRLLGRRGYMNVDLVLGPEQLPAVQPQFNSLLSGFSYTEGQRYAEFREGDKVAAYGLTALIAGGAGALAVKTGLLQKFWKLIVVVFVAIAGFLKKIFRALFGRGEMPNPAEENAPQA